MKMHVQREALAQVLQNIQNVTDRKTNMPVLSNALLRASDDQILEVCATDLELSLRTRIPAQVERAGTTTVLAKKLFDIVRELPQDLVSLEAATGERLVVRAGRSRFELASIPADDFPEMKFYDDAPLGKVEGPALGAALAKTIYSVPADENPFSVCGLYLHGTEDGNLRFVGSDGHRLAYAEMPRDAVRETDVGRGIIIPRKAVQEILRMLEKEAGLFMGLHENALIARGAETVLAARLFEGEFPEYQLIIPEERANALTVDREAFHAALKRVGVLTNQKWRHVKLIAKKGALEMEAGDPELGNARDAIDADYEGEDFSIAFSIRYVQEAIAAMQSATVRFEWVDQFHGGVFIGPEDPGYFTLIMPMVL